MRRLLVLFRRALARRRRQIARKRHRDLCAAILPKPATRAVVIRRPPFDVTLISK